MTPDDIKYLGDLVKRESGLVLSEDKSYMLESRLTPLVRKRGLANLSTLVDEVKSGNDGIIKDITEVMTTKESFFLRDLKPFELLKDRALPYYINQRAEERSLRIWCAAASSGQEPYSIAMVLREMAQDLSDWNIDIVGSDISGEILDKALQGRYTQFEVQRGLPIQFLLKYFEQIDENWQINHEIRDMVSYQEFNLLEDPSCFGNFDIVFCRNVLTYFDQQTKTSVLDRIAKIMPDDGLLFLGSSETVLGVSDQFRPIPSLRGVYEVAKNSDKASFWL